VVRGLYVCCFSAVCEFAVCVIGVNIWMRQCVCVICVCVLDLESLWYVCVGVYVCVWCV